MNPLVSVIVPFYNAEKYIVEALSSILAQVGVAIEVIAVDDGSTDMSVELARSAGDLVRCISQEQQGTAAALNLGISESRGEYLGFLDADDYWVNDKLRSQLDTLEMKPELDFLFGHMQHFYSPELSNEERAEVVCPPDPMPGYSLGTMLIRSDSFKKVGDFSSEWRVGEFLDWFLKAREANLTFACEEKLVLMRRIHAANKGRVLKQAREDYLWIIRSAMQRKKKNSS